MNFTLLNEWVFSKKNIVGCAFGAFGLLLYVFGLVDYLWWLIALGFYALGYFIVPKNKQINFYHLEKETLTDYKGFLERLIKNTESNLPHNALEKINSIKQSSFELIDFLNKDQESLNIYSENITSVKMIFEKYLPNLLNRYIKLPKRYAENIKLKNNKTSKDLLLEQLTLLDEQISKIAYAIYENDTQALQVHGNFLKQKFENQNLFELEA